MPLYSESSGPTGLLLMLTDTVDIARYIYIGIRSSALKPFCLYWVESKNM